MQLLTPACGLAHNGRVQAELPQGVGQALPGGVSHRQCFGLKLAGQRLATDQRVAEAHAFLVAECHDFDGEGQPSSGFGEGLHAVDGGHHAEHAIVLAGVTHRVEMRAQHQARQIRFDAFVPANHIADGVDARLHAGFPHPVEHQFAGGGVLRGQKDASEAIGQFRALGQCITAGHDAHGIGRGG